MTKQEVAVTTHFKGYNNMSVHTACAHCVCANGNVGFAVEDKRVPSSSKPSQKLTVLRFSRWW